MKNYEKELKKGCGCQNSYWKKDICEDGNLCDDCGLKLEGFQKAKELFKKKVEGLKVYSAKNKKGNVRDCILVEELLNMIGDGE